MWIVLESSLPPLHGNAMQVGALQYRCATQLMRELTVDSFAETAVLADSVKHQGLLDASLDFANLIRVSFVVHSSPS